MSSEYYLLDDKYREGANITKDAVRMYCRTRPRQYALTSGCDQIFYVLLG